VVCKDHDIQFFDILDMTDRFKTRAPQAGRRIAREFKFSFKVTKGIALFTLMTGGGRGTLPERQAVAGAFELALRFAIGSKKPASSSSNAIAPSKAFSFCAF
jgi:hypothetical protein